MSYTCTVEPRYNEVFGTMKITLLYQFSHIRVKKQRNIKSWDQQNYLVIRGFCYIRPLYNEVPLYHQIGSRTTPHEDNFPPDKNKAQPLPTRTTIPRTIPHQDNSPLGPLPRNKTTHQDQNLYGGELSSWGVVRIHTKYT